MEVKKDFVCHGDILYASSAEKLEVFSDSWLVVTAGRVEGIYEKLPEKFSHMPLKDYGRGLIIPAFSDLHIHASQFVQRGIGMDKLLFDWLNDYTFPQLFYLPEKRKPLHRLRWYKLKVNDGID